MNTEQANQIDLRLILDKLGFHPTKTRGCDLWYLSPFRTEKTASFHLNTKANVWNDFGEEIGGTAIDFLQEYMKRSGEDHDVRNVLQRLKSISLSLTDIAKFPKPEFTKIDSALTIREKSEIKNSHLINYLSLREIPLRIAKKYLKQVYIHNSNTGKNFMCLAFRNDEGGYELRNEFFKSCISPKTVTFIRGEKPFPKEVHVFEGWPDFLSVIAFENKLRLQGDAVILNSVACLSHTFPYLKGYSYDTIYSWMDNDNAGRKATDLLEAFASEEKISHKAKNKIYASYKDVNEWRMHVLCPKK